MRQELILGLMAGLLASNMNAAPTVTSVNASGMSNATIEISGSGFGAAPQVTVFDQFETDAVAGAKIPINKALVGSWFKADNAPEYDPIAHSGKFSARTWVGSPRKMGQLQASLPEGTTNVLISYWVHIPPGTPFPGAFFTGSNISNWSDDSSWKMAWLFDQSYRGEDADICLPTHSGYGIFHMAGNDGVKFGDVEGRVGLKPSWWNWNSWMRMTLWLRANTDDPLKDGDWYFNVISEGKAPFTLSGRKPVFDADGASIKQFRRLNVPGWFREQSSQDMRPLYDDVYVATGPSAAARVEIGNAPELSKVTAMELQPVVSWSDSKVVVKLNTGGITNLGSAYLYVTDKNNATNSRGIPLFDPPASPVLSMLDTVRPK